MGSLADHMDAALPGTGSLADREIAFWASLIGAGGAVGFNGSYAAVGTDVLSSRITADANPRFTLNADGSLEWGSGAGALDTNLYRSAASTLKTDDNFHSTANVLARTGVSAQVSIGNLGPATEAGILFGSDGDTNLYRLAANALKTNDGFLAVLNITAQADGPAVRIGDQGPASQAGIKFGSGLDVNLYRSAADTLKTDDNFHVTLEFRHLGATLGFYNAAAVAKAAFVASPTSDIAGTKAAIDAIRTVLINLGLTAAS